MNNLLNRTTVLYLTNKSGVTVSKGDTVIIDSANNQAFTTTTTSGYVNGVVGVVLDATIANNTIGAIAIAGWIPQINLSSSASLNDFFKTHTVAKQAVRHAAPEVAGDFGQVLSSGTNPPAVLFTVNQGGSSATGSGGGVLLKNYWSPDAPPASPSGTDSEFDEGSGSVPSGFTEYDPGTLLTVTESSSYKNVQLLAATTAVTLDVLGIYKAIPAGDFTIWTKVHFLGAAVNYNFAGLCLWEDATDQTKKIAGYGISPRAAAVVDNGIYNFTNWNTFASAVESNFQFVAPCLYIRLRRTSTTYKMAFSSDGEAFLEYSAAVNPDFTPTHFGVGIGNTTGENALATFDFFRYVASDVGLTGIMAGQEAGIYE